MPIAALGSSQQGRFKAVQQKNRETCGNGFSQGLVITQPQITLQPDHRNFHILKTLPAPQGFRRMKKLKELSPEAIDRIIEMAWEDRTPFDAILSQFGVTEGETIQLMRHHMKKSSFKMWRARVQGRSTKHSKKAPEDLITFKSRMQRGIALNKMPKR
jgi:uncharacterized protein (TIGR03643 family)